MKDPRRIIKHPIVTEKSLLDRDVKKRYTFAVAPDANKNDVKHAIESIFHVHVIGVNIMKIKGKVKRLGRFEGRRADWKKAVVRLAADEHIEELTGGA
ncbi:50S ribosomal protein L23 [candidate division WOR-3 bacterium]|nr:50S ribosomal protein L23 [candidate division WOR-3 bacterium]